MSWEKKKKKKASPYKKIKKRSNQTALNTDTGADLSASMPFLLLAQYIDMKLVKILAVKNSMMQTLPQLHTSEALLLTHGIKAYKKQLLLFLQVSFNLKPNLVHSVEQQNSLLNVDSGFLAL